jgi:hypothetical protein
MFCIGAVCSLIHLMKIALLIQIIQDCARENVSMGKWREVLEITS